MEKLFRFFFYLLFWFCSIQGQAQVDSLNQDAIHNPDSTYYKEQYEDEISTSTIPPDTLQVQPRKFDESKLNELRKDKDFDYSQAPTVGESLWERFWRWLKEILAKILRGAVTTDWGRVLLYAGCLAVLVVVVMALLKVDAFKVFFKGADVSSVAGVFHEDIHAMDFEALIKEAVEQNDFRNAVRLVFLYSLKLLADGQHIQWQPGKTNHDYLDELETQELKTGLSELSFYFDYAWYGGFAVSALQFDRVQSIFKNWRGGIR